MLSALNPDVMDLQDHRVVNAIKWTISDGDPDWGEICTSDEMSLFFCEVRIFLIQDSHNLVVASVTSTHVTHRRLHDFIYEYRPVNFRQCRTK
tara:strand:+ start:435 stop:713 length:279 start_codon:yes stop_codon:yes gene_type:complete